MSTQSGLYDLLVIGGGINGAGIAADAAGRGLRVILCEADDLAGATSSASSKLIHGGLRYLEQYDFRLVRKALAEREILLAKAPHIAWPLRFILPHSPELRPRWMLRAGLFLYDHLARRRRLPASSALRLDTPELGLGLKPHLHHGFAYWDCWVDDARLVVLNAMAAAERGAEILTRTKVLNVRPVDGRWHATLSDRVSGTHSQIAARVVVNAAGPWASEVLKGMSPASASPPTGAPDLLLVKGSHIVVPRLSTHDDAMILQNVDGRVVFVLPYEGEFSLIGTTDVPFSGDPRDAVASEEEIEYLLDAVGRYFATRPHGEHVVHAFAGVRPLYEENTGKSASAASRDYVIHATPFEGATPVISVLGGKITTYRQLAEAVMTELQPQFPRLGPSWTADAPLPGGDMPDANFEAFLDELAASRPSLPRQLLASLARRHGTLTAKVIGDASEVSDLGRHYGHDLYHCELDYLVSHEWARTAEDILWRRTKAGLHMTLIQRQAVAETLQEPSHAA